MILYIQSFILILFLSFLNINITSGVEYNKDLYTSICSAMYYRDIDDIKDAGISCMFFKPIKIKKQNIKYYEIDLKKYNYDHKNDYFIRHQLYGYLILNDDMELYINNVKLNASLMQYHMHL